MTINVYVAGPMRGKPEFNFPAFNKATHALRKRSFVVFNPAERDRDEGLDPTGMTGNENLEEQGFSVRDALAADVAFIANEADVVAVLDGWKESAGARAEVALARALGLPVVPANELAKYSALHIKPEGTLRLLDDGSNVTARDNSPWTNFVKHVPSEEAMERAAKALGLDRAKPGTPTYSAGQSVHVAMGASPTGEVRTTSSTGGEKGMKPERFDLIPVGPLRVLARHYAAGAEKYDDHQWRKGYEWSKSYAALMRHLTAWWNGEDIDAETGSHHLAAVAWHAFTLLEFIENHQQFDDRFKGQ